MKNIEQIPAGIKLAPTKPASFEAKAFEKFKHELTPAEQEYFQSKVVSAIEERPRLDDFAYSSDQKAEDRKHLADKQKMANINANYIRAKIIEHFLANSVEMQNWLGQEVRVTDTSEFDDWLNGIDSVFEFETEPPLRLAVDFTTETDSQKIKDRKLIPLLLGIESGRLSEAKYFISQLPGDQEHLTRLPKVTVAIAKENISGLINRSRQAIDKSWLKFLVLEEIKAQLEYILAHNHNPRRKHYDSHTAAALDLIYVPLLNKIKEIYNVTVDEVALKNQRKTPALDRGKLNQLMIEKLKVQDQAFAALMALLES